MRLQVQSHTCADVEASCRLRPPRVPPLPPLFRGLGKPYPPRVCNEPPGGEAAYTCVLHAALRNHNITLNHSLKDMRASFRSPCQRVT
mmetsp:Transcript_49880/g.99249  ORF Transcript_49880/g.99249 Transcript_49880/m.99249 type:complete len:88 (+) Transcript_49880:883-1146(+)